MTEGGRGRASPPLRVNNYKNGRLDATDCSLRGEKRVMRTKVNPPEADRPSSGGQGTPSSAANRREEREITTEGAEKAQRTQRGGKKERNNKGLQPLVAGCIKGAQGFEPLRWGDEIGGHGVPCPYGEGE